MSLLEPPHQHKWHLVEYKPKKTSDLGDVILLTDAYAKFFCEGCGATKTVEELEDV